MFAKHVQGPGFGPQQHSKQKEEKEGKEGRGRVRGWECSSKVDNTCRFPNNNNFSSNEKGGMSCSRWKN